MPAAAAAAVIAHPCWVEVLWLVHWPLVWDEKHQPPNTLTQRRRETSWLADVPSPQFHVNCHVESNP